MSVETPELDRFLAAIAPRQVNDVLSEFLDWLTDHEGYDIVHGEDAVYAHRLRCPSDTCRNGYDKSAMTPRQLQVLGEVRAPLPPDLPICPTCKGERYIEQERIDSRAIVRFPRKAAVIADFLGLDEDKMEDERRALLAGLREEAA